MAQAADETTEYALVDIATYVAELARDLFEPIWPEWKRMGGHPRPDGLASEDACIPSSLALRAILERTLPEYNWHAVGGRPTARTPHGGYRGPDGQGGCHMWVEGRLRRGSGLPPGGRMVADITADQFGGPRVLVLDAPSPHHHANYGRPMLARLRSSEAIHVELWLGLFDATMQAEALARGASVA